MHFGSMQVATLWRLTKAGVVCRAIVMDGVTGLRLVVVETDRIVCWEQFPLARQLRARAVTIRRTMRRSGWLPVVRGV